MKNSKIYLEHANITVSDLPAAVRFFQAAFPGWKIRGGGENDGEWLHLGSDHTYLALNQGPAGGPTADRSYVKNGLNHLGFVVDDVAGIAQRLLAAGYRRSFPKQVERFRIRDYFLDDDDNEYEFVQYLSESPAERNDYSE